MAMSPAGLLALSLMAGFGYDAYRGDTCAAFEARQRCDHPDMRLGQLDGRDYGEVHPLEKLRIRAVYAGKTRRLSGHKGKTVADWCRVYFPEMADGFRREILVREGDRERWLPIQEPLWISFEHEVSKGATVELYVVWFGTANEEFIYLVNEFRA